MHVYIHACIHIEMYTDTYICTQQTCTHVYTHTCTCTQTHKHKTQHMYINTQTHMYTNIIINTYM